MAKKNIKIDLNENGTAQGILPYFKELERKKLRRPKKISILNGYVLTNHPEKWEEHKIE